VSGMFAHVLSTCHHNEILWAVVRLDLVDVMNNLVVLKLAAQRLFCDVAMLRDVATAIDPYPNVVANNLLAHELRVRWASTRGLLLAVTVAIPRGEPIRN